MLSTLSWQNCVGHCRIQKRNATFFTKLDIAFEKNQIEIKGELKVEVEGHLQLLKQEFERYFPDSSDTELPETKIKGIFSEEKYSFRRFTKKCLGRKIHYQKNNFTTKNNFEAMSLTNFWVKYVHIDRNVLWVL